MPDVSAQDSVLTFDCMLLLQLHSYILDFYFYFIYLLDRKFFYHIIRLRPNAGDIETMDALH